MFMDLQPSPLIPYGRNEGKDDRYRKTDFRFNDLKESKKNLIYYVLNILMDEGSAIMKYQFQQTRLNPLCYLHITSHIRPN